MMVGGDYMYFDYSYKELEYLKDKDSRFGEVIDKVGMIDREVEPDLFRAICFNIIGQQISIKGYHTVLKRLNELLPTISPFSIYECDVDKLQACGIGSRKVSYLKNIAEKIINKEFDVERIYDMDDECAIEYLMTLKGVGRWTAEMILLFTLQRKNVFSYYDLGIKRGLMKLYNYTEISMELFNMYKGRFSPYCSIASFYLWKVGNGEVEI